MLLLVGRARPARRVGDDVYLELGHDVSKWHADELRRAIAHAAGRLEGSLDSSSLELFDLFVDVAEAWLLRSGAERLADLEDSGRPRVELVDGLRGRYAFGGGQIGRRDARGEHGGGDAFLGTGGR